MNYGESHPWDTVCGRRSSLVMISERELAKVLNATVGSTRTDWSVTQDTQTPGGMIASTHGRKDGEPKNQSDRRYAGRKHLAFLQRTSSPILANEKPPREKRTGNEKNQLSGDDHWTTVEVASLFANHRAHRTNDRGKPAEILTRPTEIDDSANRPVGDLPLIPRFDSRPGSLEKPGRLGLCLRSLAGQGRGKPRSCRRKEWSG